MSFAYQEHVESFGLAGDSTLIIEPTGGGQPGGEVPALSVDTTIRQATRGRGQVLSVACAAEHVYIATTRGCLLQYSWDEYGNEKVSEVEVVKGQADNCVTALWVDPTAAHIILTTRVQGVTEVHYLHRRWQKTRPLTKLRGTCITAVGWAQAPAPGAVTSPSGGGPAAEAAAGGGKGAAGKAGTAKLAAPPLDEHCTGTVLLGTDQGLLHELVVDERQASRKDPGAPHQLLDLRDRRKAVTGLHQERLDDGALLVLVATPLALYAARGPPGSTSMDAVFAPYTTVPLQPALEAMALPTPSLPASSSSGGGAPGSSPHVLPHSSLRVLPPSEHGLGPTRFGWLVGTMIYHGELQLAPPPPPPSPSLPPRSAATPRPTASPSPPTTAAAAASAARGVGAGPGAGQPLGGEQQLGAGRGGLSPEPEQVCLSGEGLLRNVALLPLNAASDPPPASQLNQGAGQGGLGRGGAASSGVTAMGRGVMYERSQPTSPMLGGGRTSGGGQLEDEPRAMAMTEFHFILLVGDRVRAINRVSGLTVSELVFRSPLLAKAVSGEVTRTVDGLVQDVSTRSMYMYSDESLYEVQLRQEARDMWRVFMGQRDWDAALKMCGSPQQRDEVHRARASAAYDAKDYDTAALHWAKVVGGQPPFEDVALRLVEAESPSALMLFLSTRLDCLGRSDRAQSTMVAAWLTELMLDRINQQLLQAGGVSSGEHAEAEQQLQVFLKTHVEVLDVGTTVNLLGAYGRMDDLLVFAQARQDHEAVLEALLQRPGGASRALAVLRKPSCAPALTYRFAPALVAAAPQETVDHLIAARPPLEPRLLIPALLRFVEPGASAAGRAAVLRYVEYALEVLKSQDKAVHNLAAALHTLADSEAGLLSYLARAHTASGRPLYDLKYVLRMAMERNKPRAAVKLLCKLGMYEDAVSKALAVDLALSKEVAMAPPGEEEEGLRRRLWLAIAQHVVQQGGASSHGPAAQAAAIKQAVEFLKEAGGLLKIEDVLPFFPDFVTIDNFKEAICDSLERYNRQIEVLKCEMEESTEIADAVRADLAVLATRTATVSLAAPCARCGRPLASTPPDSAIGTLPAGGAMPSFLVFPSGLVYHGSCCAAEVCELAAPVIKQRVVSAAGKLGRRHKGDESAQVLLGQLLDDIGAGDPRNGELVVRLVDAPYLLPADNAESATWII